MIALQSVATQAMFKPFGTAMSTCNAPLLSDRASSFNNTFDGARSSTDAWATARMLMSALVGVVPMCNVSVAWGRHKAGVTAMRKWA